MYEARYKAKLGTFVDRLDLKNKYNDERCTKNILKPNPQNRGYSFIIWENTGLFIKKCVQIIDVIICSEF